MNRTALKIVLLSVLALSGFGVVYAAGQASQEVLVQTTPTKLPSVTGQRAVEVQNLGPNAIYCSLGGNVDGGPAVYAADGGVVALTGKARMVQAYTAGQPADAWAVEVPEYVPVWCTAATANQVTGAATIVTAVSR